MDDMDVLDVEKMEQEMRDGIRKALKPAAKMSDAPGRPMKFPYTISAKIAQFPIKFYIQNQWIWRYWMLGIAASLPIFYKIHKLANSPENVSKWAEIRRKEAAGHH